MIALIQVLPVYQGMLIRRKFKRGKWYPFKTVYKSDFDPCIAVGLDSNNKLISWWVGARGGVKLMGL